MRKQKFQMTSEKLENRLIKFASRILKLVEALPKNPSATHLAGQLRRSGTSPALNYGEVRGAQSTPDFIHKKRVCLKELRESYNCLRLIDNQNWFTKGRLYDIIKENGELIAIFVTSIKTVEKRLHQEIKDGKK